MIKPILHSLLIFVLCCLGASTIQAQDIHYSQFYQAPLLLNPSLTGHMPAKARVNAMYRSQWPTISTNRAVYETPSVAFDMNLLRGENQLNSLGVGLSLMNDRSSGGLLNRIQVMGSVAYHLDLKKNSKFYLSPGLQFGVINKRVKLNEILFADQVDTSTGEINSTSVETGLADKTSIWLPDFRFGLTFAGFPSTRTRFKVGAALFHLTQPRETFFDIPNKLPLRLVAHADARFLVGNRIGLEPKLLFQTQARAMELVGGMLFDIKVIGKSSLYLGGEMRVDSGVDGIGLDAGMAILGLRIEDWDVGVSYDFNISELDVASGGRGALEFSLVKIFRRAYRIEPILPAIREN